MNTLTTNGKTWKETAPRTRLTQKRWMIRKARAADYQDDFEYGLGMIRDYITYFRHEGQTGEVEHLPLNWWIICTGDAPHWGNKLN